MRKYLSHLFRLGAILVIVWLLLSSIYEPLMLSFGVISVFISLWLTKRMLRIDQEQSHSIPVQPA
ncbi:hypothetical protein GPAL_1646 [Glaciecola pallidula DSM 14239 = ACAM 615]|uniref:Uncharacterized protein n=1 Tax=Brumicola pallidula DSM 14239 = ACAM 615 TaxID=1121922 RepID=K6ZYZ1_9ALTE|nr:hypothetical protein GPAL_1646 [Glaciecola pallidula DSM 14239 = ACAM 615]